MLTDKRRHETLRELHGGNGLAPLYFNVALVELAMVECSAANFVKFSIHYELRLSKFTHYTRCCESTEHTCSALLAMGNLFLMLTVFLRTEESYARIGGNVKWRVLPFV